MLLDIYALIHERDLAASIRAATLAEAAVTTATASEQLALYYAIVEGHDAFLGELGEHGRWNQALWGVELADVNIGVLVERCRHAYEAAAALVSRGIELDPRLQPYISNQMFPIGSRDWLAQNKRAIEHRDNAWVGRIKALLLEELEV